MTSSAVSRPYTSENLRELLGPAACSSEIDESAPRIMAHLDPAVVEAVGIAIAEAAPTVHVRRVFGYQDAEDLSWYQLILDVGGHDPDSAEWKETLDLCGRAMDLVVDRRPELARKLSEVGFHF